jgi:fumarate reductase flavoprotein subunit
MSSKELIAPELAADIVIIGAGSAGLSAALTAAQGGASVILLEKADKVGGAGNYAEGVFGVETEMQRKLWMNVTRENVFLDEMNDARWESNFALVRRFQGQSAATIDWLIAQGVAFDGPMKNDWTNTPTWHVITGHGKEMVKILLAHLETFKSVKILLNTSAKALITTNGRVAGVHAQTADGKLFEVSAGGGVIVATGGFANSPEMLEKYANLTDVVQLADIGRTGDGINMSHAAGAQFDTMSPVMMQPMLDMHGEGHHFSMDEMLLSMIGLEPRNIWVDKFGKRFANEVVAFDFPFAANALRRVKFAWSIFDDAMKERYMTKGIDVGLGVIIPPLTVVTNFDSLWQKAIAGGNTAVVQADTLAALAKATSLPLPALEATLEQYNASAAVNVDEAFGKDRRWLQPISAAGPFYALRISYAITTTLGGIKVDDHLHALDANDLPIPGLYLTGNDAGGLVAADSYTVTAAPGTSFGFAVGSGRMAADDILEHLNSDSPARHATHIELAGKVEVVARPS